MLYDAPGPRARRRAWIGSGVALLVVAALVTVAVRRLADRGQLDEARWDFVSDPAVLRFLAAGLLNTLKAAAVAGVFAFALGFALAVGRLAPSRLVRAAATVWVQFWRAIPLLLFILFISLGLPVLGVKLPVFWFLVIGLAVYNSAVFAEIIRAGVLALPRGQAEAAASIGLTFWQGMRLVRLPQAVRFMVPSLVSQFVVLLKDSSLGFVLPYSELLHRGRITGSYEHSILQAYAVVAVVYIAVNASLSYLARYLERRTRATATRGRGRRGERPPGDSVTPITADTLGGYIPAGLGDIGSSR